MKMEIDAETIESLSKSNRIDVIVKANSNKTDVVGYDEEDGVLKIEVKAPAKDNKANIEVVKFLSRLLKKKVKIIKGKTSKRKTVSF